jgi:RND family efflux transporter MFP subunit
MNRVKRTVQIGVSLLLVGGIAFGAALRIGHKTAALADAPTYGVRPMPVHVARARTGDLSVSRGYLAIVEPVRSATLTARVTSLIERVEVDEGDTVHAGQLLVSLDDREIRSTVAAMDAQVAQAEAERQANDATVAALEHSLAYRQREADRLHRAQASSAASVNERESAQDKADETAGQLQAARQQTQALTHRLEAIRQQLVELKTRLTYYRIESPYDGIISRRHVDAGDMAIPGKTLLVIEDRNNMRLAFGISQQDLPDMRAGMSVTYNVADSVRTALLTALYPSLDDNRVLRAEVRLDAGQADGLTCGSYVPMRVQLKRYTNVTFVPSSAVVESVDGDHHVWTVTDGRLERHTVQLLGTDRHEAAVEGIEPGRDVVLNTFLGWARLGQDQAVEVMP